MLLAQKIRIQPSPEQEEVLWALSEKCRLIYNFALKERKEAYEKGEKTPTFNKQCADLPTIKEEYPEYKWVYSKVLQNTLRTLDQNFKSFYALNKKGDAKAKPPKYKGKKYFTTLKYNQSGFKQEEGIVKFSHKHPSKEPLEFTIPNKFTFQQIKQIDLYQNRDEEWYISIVHEEKTPEYEDNGAYQAFDLGVTKHAATNSQGKSLEVTNQRPDKYWDKRIRAVQSKRDHCKKGSRRWKRYHSALRTMKRKASNQLKDYQHKITTQLVNNTKANTLILGDLSVKDLCQINPREKTLHTSLHNSGTIARFVQYLTYKAERVGKSVKRIDERYTSKTCCCCGEQQEMPLSKRTYNCGTCGNELDRDVNSSINILLRYLSQNGLWTAYQRTVGNLRQTGVAIR